MNIEVVDSEMARVLKKKTPQERLLISFRMWDSTRKQLVHYLKTIHPEWSESEVN